MPGPASEEGLCCLGFRALGFRYWALEYHTLILVSLKGTIMKKKFILSSPWLLESPVKGFRDRVWGWGLRVRGVFLRSGW